MRDAQIDAGDGFAVVGYRHAGTHEVPMTGQATGKPIAMAIAMASPLVFRLRDGRIAHLRTMTGDAGAMRVAASAGYARGLRRDRFRTRLIGRNQAVIPTRSWQVALR